MKKTAANCISKRILNFILLISPLVFFTFITVSYIGERIIMDFGVMVATPIVLLGIVLSLVIVSNYIFLYVYTKMKERDYFFFMSIPCLIVVAMYLLRLFITYYWEYAIPICKAICFILVAIVMCRIAQRRLINNDRKILYWIVAVVMSVINTALAIFSNAMWTDIRFNLPQFNLDYSYFIWNELHYRIGIISAIRYPALLVISFMIFVVGFIQYKISKRQKLLIMIVNLEKLGEI